MAEAIRNLSATGWGYVRGDHPTTHYNVTSGTWYELGGYNDARKFMYVKFAAMPSSLKRKQLLDFRVVVQAKGVIDTVYNLTIDGWSSFGSFDPATITYANMPETGARFAMSDIFQYADSPLDVGIQRLSSSYGGSYIRRVLANGICLGSTSSVYVPAIQNKLLGGGTPYVQVTYDDAVNVTSQVSDPVASSRESNDAIKFSWSLNKADSSIYCADETWTQASAVFYWKKSTDSSYTAVNISGSTMSKTFPAYTFPTGGTINYYVKVTDTDGTTTQSSVKTMTLAGISMDITTCPTDGATDVDGHKAIKFAWQLRSTLDSSHTYAQKSAKILWREYGTSTWNEVVQSGSTKSLTVPANTFPPSTVIEWKLQVTLPSDEVFTLSTARTFTTARMILTANTYPTGSSVDNRVAIPFAFTLSSTAGNVYNPTKSGVIWRPAGTSTWRRFEHVGTQSSWNVVAYAFPANTTIEWYLYAYDVDDCYAYTETLTFKTLPYSLAISSAPTGSNIDTRNAITFSWTISNAQGAVTQSSAIFYWRVSGASSYTQVSISGNTKSVSIPANTFPTGKTIQWYVRVTAADGTVLQSSAATFNTVSTKVTLDTYPSGNDVYTAAVLRWTWHLASNVGNYSQASAKLYWRVSTSSTYTAINVSGNTQALNVAANTFPTNKTIQWYVEATDVGGLTSTTSVMSFKTVTTQITPQNSPTSGYADPRNAIKFQWYFASTGGAVPQASATFYWRISGESSWSSVAASGSTASVTIPANTFPVASTIEWYISGTDVGGTSSTSQVYSFSTAAETAYAYPQAPIGVTVDTGKAVTLHWILANADGTQPSRVELSYKLANESSWTVIHAENAAFTEWTTAAGYFPVGEIEWRVIATNRDGVEGPAGTAAFISLRAPDAPVGLTATAVPRTTIRWQGGDQEAYEIIIDGETVQQAYGTEVNEWTPDFVLEDGIHVIAVRIQGPYGLWSDPSITTIDVANQIPAGWEDLTLAGRFDVDAILTMSGAESPASPSANWFRDGKRIAVTHGSREYSDRYVLGEHRYWVELWAEDGNYARSNVLTGTLKSCITRIALFEGGGWVDLKLSENSAGEQAFTYGRTASARHVLGTAYPVLEVSEFEDLSGSYDCAFRDTESAAQLEAMRGRVVILKSRGGRVLIGLLSPLETRYTDFYIACRFTVSAIDWEDFRDVL